MRQSVYYSTKIIALAVSIGFFCSCERESIENRNSSLFELKSSEETGIVFSNQVETTDSLSIIEYLYFYNGAGVAIGDMNNDSLPEIIFASNQGENTLYLNKGDFSFEDISKSAGVSGNGEWSNGITLADVNGDDYLDIYVSVVADYKGLKGHNLLYINNKNLTFTESSEAYGLDFSGFGTHAAFFDFDADGDLDVYLLNHSVHDASSYGPSTLRNKYDEKSGDRLFVNLLNEGKNKFKEVTQEAGVYSSRIGYGLGVVAQDFNLDGWTDLYISNDFHENDYLYINQKDGTFSEELTDRIQHTSRYSMGNDAGDINNDGFPEIMTLDMLPYDPTIQLKSVGEDNLKVSEIKRYYGYGPQLVQNTLQLNLQNGTYSDIAMMNSMHASDWSWSPLIVDLDNDGFKDVHISNGIFKRPNDLDYIQYIASQQQELQGEDADEKLIEKMPTLKISNAVFQNQDGLHFTNVSEKWGLAAPSYSNGSAYGDLDNDGDLDLVINNVNQLAHIYENHTDNQNNFLKIRLKENLNTFGVGSKVDVYIGKEKITNQVYASHGFQSASELVLTIGLGKAESVDSLVITWPGNYLTKQYDLETNKLYVFEKENVNKYSENRNTVNPVLRAVAESIPFLHRENNYDDFDRQFLLPYKLSTKGPALAVGDVNGDGLDDVFVGGAYGQAASLYIQKDNQFTLSNQLAFEIDKFSEDVDATFADFDQDGDLDLFVVSGGAQVKSGDISLQDRLYINTNGKFEKSINWSGPSVNSSSVTLIDIDQDGDQDIFVGADTEPGAYGMIPKSYLAINNNGKLTIDNGFDGNLGFVNDAQSADMDGDGDEDLVVVGHWMPITILINENAKLSEKIKLEMSSGMWNEVALADLNHDGLLDIVGANFGLNNKFQATIDYPLQLHVADFDGNGSVDPIILKYEGGKYIPLMTKDDLTRQLSVIKKNFNSNKQFAEQINGIESFGFPELTEQQRFDVVELRSCVFYNQKNFNFNKVELPDIVQKSSMNAIIIDDLNGDDRLDLIMAGNEWNTHINLGRYDASYGELLLNMGSGWQSVSNLNSGLSLNGQVRNSAILETSNSKQYVFAENNGKLIHYTITKDEK